MMLVMLMPNIHVCTSLLHIVHPAIAAIVYSILGQVCSSQVKFIDNFAAKVAG